jgi:hypothetical protein
MGQISHIDVQTPGNQFIFRDTSMGASPDVVSSSAATLYFIVIDNSFSARACYVQLFDAVSGVTVGTSPADAVIFVPGSASLAPGSSIVTCIYMTAATPGLSFSNGILAAATTTPSGSTSPTVNLDVKIGYASTGGGGNNFF